jgi:hypothetical protein
LSLADYRIIVARRSFLKTVRSEITTFLTLFSNLLLSAKPILLLLPFP